MFHKSVFKIYRLVCFTEISSKIAVFSGSYGSKSDKKSVSPNLKN